MTHGLLPVRTAHPTDPQSVVESFLAALAEPDLAGAGALLDEAVVYTNVGLPTIRGRRRVVRVLSLLDRPGCRFEVYLHAVAADGAVVLTERTDVIELGRVRLQFWVTGRFDVQAGQITLWRDSFDYLDTTKALVRGLLGALVPRLRPRPPSALDSAPGRH
jgi:limonene-1,2-epoxide hydrolase